MNGKSQRRVLAIATVIGAAFLGAAFLAACNPPASDQHLQQQAAQATEQAKQGSKEALADARVAAKNAEQAVNDVAAGVKQGLHNDNAPDESRRLDLNSASQADLESLQGISVGKARQIIDHRPYTSSHDLVKDGLLTQRQFDEIAPKVTVH